MIQVNKINTFFAALKRQRKRQVNSDPLYFSVTEKKEGGGIELFSLFHDESSTPFCGGCDHRLNTESIKFAEV